MVKLTNSNILSVFRKQMGISKADETAFVEAFQSIFEEALLRDKTLKISGLGTFKLIPVESRRSVNVNTGEEIEIAGHYKLTFTPDTALKDKVNEPLAHLETVELDVDVVVEHHEEQPIAPQQVPVDLPETILSQDDPLQKLTEQALELKDILADIQALSVVESVSSAQLDQPEQMDEPNSSDNSDLSDASDMSDSTDKFDSSNQPTTSDNCTDSNQSPQPIPTPESPTQPEPISARDVVAEINHEDIAPSSKKSKLWVWLAVILGVSIIGLLVYQNRNFFALSEEVIVKSPVIAEEPIEPQLSISDTIAQSDSLLQSDSLDSQEVDLSDTTDTQLSTLDSQLDTTSILYSDKFSDVFNLKREYTEFIDTVTLNEGSRLTWISFKQYGHRDYWVYIYEANRDIVKNPNAIKVGTELRIPQLAPELIDATNPETIEYARYLHDIYVKK